MVSCETNHLAAQFRPKVPLSALNIARTKDSYDDLQTNYPHVSHPISSPPVRDNSDIMKTYESDPASSRVFLWLSGEESHKRLKQQLLSEQRLLAVISQHDFIW